MRPYFVSLQEENECSFISMYIHVAMYFPKVMFPQYFSTNYEICRLYIDQFGFKCMASAIYLGGFQEQTKDDAMTQVYTCPELKQYIVWKTHLLSCSWKPPRYGGWSDVMFLKPNWSIRVYYLSPEQNTQ